MKVSVNVVNVCNVEICPAADFVVSPSEEILAVKGRIADLSALPFSALELLKGGEPLRDGASVTECELKDGATLILRVAATDSALVSQLKDLIQDKAVAIEELGMLYVHAFGVPVGDALSALGRDGTRLQDFLGEHKAFQLDGGRVKVVAGAAKECEAIVPPPGLATTELEPTRASGEQQIELSACVRVMADTETTEETTTDITFAGSTTVEEAKNRIALAEMIPYPVGAIELGGSGPLLDDSATLADSGVGSGSALVVTVRACDEMLVEQLVKLLEVRNTMSADELGMQYCYKHGVPVARALKLLGRRPNLKRFLDTQATFTVDSGLVAVRHAK